MVEKHERSVAGTREAGERWAPHRVKSFTPVSDFFLEHYADLEISSMEAMVVVHLMSFKWRSEAPYPAIKTIAKRMGLSDTQVRTHLRNLERKGYLVRAKRVGETNKFHLDRLFQLLEERRVEVEAENPKRRRPSKEATL